MATLFCLLATACSGGGGSAGGGGGGGGSAARTDLLLTDAALDDLLAFRTTVSELRLRRQGGGTSANLLAAPLPVEFLGLEGVLGFASISDLTSGVWIGARVAFEPGSYEAVTRDGTPVAVVASWDVLDVDFAAPLQLDDSGYRRIEIDLDLGASLSGEVGSPPIAFAPSGLARIDDGSSSGTIDEIRGLVTSASAPDSLVVDAFADDDLTVPLGEVTVRVGAGTLLVGDDGAPLPSVGAFFSALTAGATLVEVHGRLGLGGRVDATRVEIEDHSGGSGSSSLVKIEGLVLGVGPGGTFELLIQEIEKGQAIASPVLEQMGSPASITVSFDAGTHFYLDADHGGGSEDSVPSDASQLAVGRRVKVGFADFLAEPFPAHKVEIESTHAEFEGSIVDASGLPASMVIHLHHSEPAILSGDVDSDQTDVTVTLAGSHFLLDTHGHPSLTVGDLLVGMKVEVKGTLSGPSGAPTITAWRTKVHAGRLDGALVTGVQPGDATFTTLGGDVDDPFGGGVTPGPMLVHVEPEAEFDGDAEDAASFYALFQNLAEGETLEVRVEGIGTGATDEVRAFEIDVKLRD